MNVRPAPCLAGCMIFASIAGCRMPSAANDAELIANLRFSPPAFDSYRRNTEILYTLAQPAHVSFSIIRRLASGEVQPVTDIFAELYESKGSHAHTWLGDTSSGLFAPPGEYVGVVTVDGCRYEAPVRVFHY